MRLCTACTVGGSCVRVCSCGSRPNFSGIVIAPVLTIERPFSVHIFSLVACSVIVPARRVRSESMPVIRQFIYRQCVRRFASRTTGTVC